MPMVRTMMAKNMKNGSYGRKINKPKAKAKETRGRRRLSLTMKWRKSNTMAA